MRSLLANLVQLGGMQVVIAGTALVRNKVLAARLGADGFGVYAQLTLLALAAAVVVAFGLGMSLNRNVAATPDRAGRQRLLAQANGVVLALTALVALALPGLLLWPDALRTFGLEPTPAVVAALLILGAFVPLEAAVQHRVAFLTGALDVKGMTSGRSLALAIGTAVSLPLVWWFGLLGAALQLTLMTLLIAAFLDRRLRRLGYRPWAIAFDRPTLRLLAGFGVASLLAGFGQRAADVVVRSALITTVDAAQNGIYQAATAITYQVKAVVLGSVGSYAIATLAQDASRAAVQAAAGRLLSVVLPIAAVALAGLGLLSGPAILVLYAPSFLEAQAVLPYLLVAEFVQVPVWVLGAPLLAMDRVRVWLAFEIGASVVRAVLALALLPTLGVVGVAVAAAATSAVQLLATGAFFVGVLRLQVAARDVALLAGGLVVVAGAAALGAGAVFELWRVAVGVVAIAAFAAVALHAVVGWSAAWGHARAAWARRSAA